MADLSVQKVVLDGITPSYSGADAAGDRYRGRDGGSHTILHVKNGDTASHTVTIDDPTTQQPKGAVAFDPDVAVSVPAGEERMVLVDTRRFANVNDWVNLSYDDVTGVTVGVFSE